MNKSFSDLFIEKFQKVKRYRIEYTNATNIKIGIEDKLISNKLIVTIDSIIINIGEILILNISIQNFKMFNACTLW